MLATKRYVELSQDFLAESLALLGQACSGSFRRGGGARTKTCFVCVWQVEVAFRHCDWIVVGVGGEEEERVEVHWMLARGA
jgi:hypothetical protein